MTDEECKAEGERQAKALNESMNQTIEKIRIRFEKENPDLPKSVIGAYIALALRDFGMKIGGFK